MRQAVLVGALALAASAQARGETVYDRLGPTRLIEGSAEIEGVWRSRGYGWIVEVADGQAMRYEIGPDWCYPMPEAARGATAMLSVPIRAYRMVPGGETASLMYLEDAMGPVYDRVSSLPPDCREPLPSDPETSFAVLIDLFEEHYGLFARRGVDWVSLRDAAEAVFAADPTEKGLREAADLILFALGDSHTKVLGQVGEERFRIQHGLGPTLGLMKGQEGPWLMGLVQHLLGETLDDGAEHTGNERIVWGTIDGRVGYLLVFTMGGFTGKAPGDADWAESELEAMDTMLDRIVERFEGMEAVILDLSNNRGGYDEVARRLIGRFTERSFEAYATTARGADVPPFPRRIDPADGPIFTGPVYLMTSDVTVSGGEISTLSARQLPNVTHVGGTTRGAFSTPLAKALSNGWIVELSNETFASPQGEIFEGRGIAPEVPLVVYDPADPVASHRKAIDAIIRRHDNP